MAAAGTSSTSTEIEKGRTISTGDRAHQTDKNTSLALDRTRLAYERTLMAWVRTAVSLISFGFTIYKFFQYLRESEPVVATTHPLMTPRMFGLAMIVLGLGSLALASFDHRRQMQALQARFAEYGPIPSSAARIVAWVVSGLGVIVLILVALRQ